MDVNSVYQYGHRDSDDESSSKTPDSEESALMRPSHSDPLGALSLGSFTHFPTGLSCKFDVELQKALRSSAEHPCVELSVYDTRTKWYLTREEIIFVKSEIADSDKVKQAVSKELNVDPENVVYFQESYTKPFVIILPSARPQNTVTLILQCRFFDQHIDDNRYCLRATKRQKISDVKDLIKNEIRWRGIELFINETHMTDAMALSDYDLKDFSLLVATKSVTKTVSFLYRPTPNIQTHFRVPIYTSDSVRIVKQKLLDHFESLQVMENKEGKCLQITCGSELLEDNRCFGMTNKFHRENMYQIHFAAPDAVICILNYQSGKERLRNLEKATILVSPKCSTAELRTEAAKHMCVDPKAVKLDIDSKLRIEEMPDISAANILYDKCLINAGIKNKKTLWVKHPVTQKTDKVASLYALEPVSTLRKMIAAKYGMNELQIVIKHKGIILKDKNLLYNYPIKNNVVLDLHIYERRTHIIANVRFKNSKMALIIDDSERTTVDDILRFCSIQLKYKSSSSRCIYKGCCLDKSLSVREANIAIGTELIILRFNEEEQLNGQLRRIFMADEDGRVVPRYGSITDGLLLFAPKNVIRIPSNEDKEEILPDGIHKTATLRKNTTDEHIETMRETTKQRPNGGVKLRRRFLRKARNLIKTKYTENRTIQEATYRKNLMDVHVDQTQVKWISSDSVAQDRNKIEFHDKETESKSSTKYVNQKDEEFTELTCPKNVIASNQTYVKMTASGSTTPKCEDEEEYRGNRTSCRCEIQKITNFIQTTQNESTISELHRPKNVMDANEMYMERKISGSITPKVGNEREYHIDRTISKTKLQMSLSEGFSPVEHSMVGTQWQKFRLGDQQMNLPTSDMEYRQRFQTLDPLDIDSVSSCKHDHALELNTSDTDNLNHLDKSRKKDIAKKAAELEEFMKNKAVACQCQLSDGGANCRLASAYSPAEINDLAVRNALQCNALRTVLEDSGISSDAGYMGDLKENSNLYKLRHRMQNVNRLRTESDRHVFSRRLPLPRYNLANRLLTTSGITIPLLEHVSSEIGRNWKNLARKLDIAETEIDELEYNRWPLYETCFQCLLLWKRKSGLKASKEVLIKALKEIKMVLLAEACENFAENGYLTT